MNSQNGITYPWKDETKAQDMCHKKHIIHPSPEETKGEDPKDIEADKGSETPHVLRVANRGGKSAGQRPLIN